METTLPPPPQPQPQPQAAQPSPGMGPAHLKDCIEELLKFTLTSSILGEVDIGLPKDYCSRLLQDDPTNSFPFPTDIFKGVLSYPLYKHLAASLYHTISCGVLVSTPDKVSFMHEDESLKLKEDEWTKLTIEKGLELLNMLKTVDFELNVQEPFFSQLKMEAKLLKEGVQMGTTTGVQVYRNFYSEEKESLNGVLAICVTKFTSPLHNFMASILLELGYAGIQRMLNMVHTVGTISEALPPPTSTLISAFLAPYHAHVKGSELTDGARALAKHVNRSSDKYWGEFCGSVHRVS